MLSLCRQEGMELRWFYVSAILCAAISNRNGELCPICRSRSSGHLCFVQAGVGEHADLLQNEGPVLAALVLGGQTVVELLPHVLDPPCHLLHLLLPFAKHSWIANNIGNYPSTVNRGVRVHGPCQPFQLALYPASKRYGISDKNKLYNARMRIRLAINFPYKATIAHICVLIVISCIMKGKKLQTG